MNKPAHLSSEQLLSRRDLAARWSTSIATIKRREREKILFPVTFNQRLIRYRLSDVEKVEAAAMKF